MKAYPFIITNTHQALNDLFDTIDNPAAFEKHKANLLGFKPEIKDWLLDAVFNMDHMIDIYPYADKHPNHDKYTIRTIQVCDRDAMKNRINTSLPEDVLHFLNDQKSNYTDNVQGDITNWSFENFPNTSTMIIIDNDLDKALYTIKELERISALVMEAYDNNDDGTNTIWEDLDLGGDDDVDYAGSYLAEACDLFRLICYIHFEDNRFLQSFTYDEKS